jgi:S-adenosylmethionine:tRNA ribosyltransferase-isomerase
MDPRKLDISDYDYPLPHERIAEYPLAERDASKLLIYREGVISEDIYRHIASCLPPRALLAFNNTKVLEARLLFRKPSGGVIEIFTLEPPGHYADMVTALEQKGQCDWVCLVGGASKWKRGYIPELQVPYTEGTVRLRAEIRERLPDAFLVRFSWTPEHLTFPEVLHLAGKTPLPPYIKREAGPADAAWYQTIYARQEGSVAAPTAGLHFTEQIFSSLAEKNISGCFVTLHVGAGTFRPVKSETMQDHQMHTEFLEVSRDVLSRLAREKRPVFAVGTTSLRTLESIYHMGAKLLRNPGLTAAELPVGQWEAYDHAGSAGPAAGEALEALLKWMTENKLETLISRTGILIAPGYRFRMISGLVTNFHQPRSTLLLLIAALLGNDWKRVYQYALEHDFRFLSYGDGCLLFLPETERV